MKYFRFSNPIRRIKLMLREIDNYYYFMRQIEILKDTGELNHYKLKSNEKHAIYGAINMPPELLLYHKNDELETLEKTYFGNEMSKLNDVFIRFDILELYAIDYERIKTDDYYAYVFNIQYRWKYCNVRSISTTIIGILATLGALAYGMFTFIQNS